jgi:hypothetical protein
MAAETPKTQGSPQITPNEREHSGSRRDPEERPCIESETQDEKRQLRERAHDKTLADSFPTSDPPSSIPDPSEEDANVA